MRHTKIGTPTRGLEVEPTEASIKKAEINHFHAAIWSREKTTSTFSGEGLKWAVSNAEQFSNRENSGFQYSCWMIYENGKQVQETRENSNCKLEMIRDSKVQRYNKQVRGGTEEPMRAETKSRSEEIQKGRYTRIQKAGKSRYKEADTIEQEEKKQRLYTKSTYANIQNVEKRGYKEQIREDTKKRYEGIQRIEHFEEQMRDAKRKLKTKRYKEN
jgi:hypothetical protein